MKSDVLFKIKSLAIIGCFSLAVSGCDLFDKKEPEPVDEFDQMVDELAATIKKNKKSVSKILKRLSSEIEQAAEEFSDLIDGNLDDDDKSEKSKKSDKATKDQSDKDSKNN